MVVHDKVYNCTSFVDEHPYVSFIPLPLSFSNEAPNPPNSLSNPTQNPTLAQSITRKRNPTPTTPPPLSRQRKQGKHHANQPLTTAVVKK